MKQKNEAVTALPFNTIFTLEARSHMLLEVMAEHFKMSVRNLDSRSLIFAGMNATGLGRVNGGNFACMRKPRIGSAACARHGYARQWRGADSWKGRAGIEPAAIALSR